MGDSRPNVLVVIFDAARAEDFSVYGYPKPTTPNLERYADRMAVYRQCVSAAMWTMPSSAGLFTGTYPSTHRLVIDGDRLDDRFVTLAELLRRHDYFTAKVTGVVPYVSDFSGLDRGFDYSFEPPPPRLRRWRRQLLRRKAAARGTERREGLDLGLDITAEAAMAAQGGFKNRLRYWATGFVDCGAKACVDHVRDLWERESSRPKFIYMHLQETHAEYRPPHRHRRCFMPSHLRHRNFAAINQRPNPHDVGLVRMTEEDYEILTGLYDGCIAYLDEQAGRLLDFLSQRPDFDETMIVFAADHGDCVGRHGILGHQFVLYDELIHIPWLVKWPRPVGLTGASDRLVQNTDLLPTICGLLDVERPAQCEGIDILREEREVAYAELLKPFGQSAVKQGLHELAPQYRRAVLAARSTTHKLIAYSNDRRDEFYDLASDPRETRNLLETGITGRHVAESTRLRAALEAWRPRWKDAAEYVDDRIFGGTGESKNIAPEVEERLRALGYID